MLASKRDLSIPMGRANVIVLFTSAPIALLQLLMFSRIHGLEKMQVNANFIILIVVLILSVIAHELIHGISWVFFGRKPFSAVKFGFQWKTLTPYAHLKEPVEVNVYRIGGFMPGFLLGILPYLLSLGLGNGNLFWFGLVHTAAASGDWLVLWLIRNLKPGTQVEDHPTNVGCYVIES
jgi:hypothetical protein